MLGLKFIDTYEIIVNALLLFISARFAGTKLKDLMDLRDVKKKFRGRDDAEAIFLA